QRGTAAAGDGLSSLGLVRRRAPGGLAVKATFAAIAVGSLSLSVASAAHAQQVLLQDKYSHAGAAFQTSDRCFVCHNGTSLPSGALVTIGSDWRASVMANSSRDPYWQASVRRESLDHPQSQPAIEDECSTCHMPIARYHSRLDGKRGEVFAHLPFNAQRTE